MSKSAGTQGFNSNRHPPAAARPKQNKSRAGVWRWLVL